MTRTVAVFTATRADAAPLAPVVAALDADPRLEPVVVACGAHLDPRRGSTIEQLPFAASIETVVLDVASASSDPLDLADTLGRLTPAMAGFLDRRRPDLVTVLGDRWELLAVCGAATLVQVPIAHLHGGEVTGGAFDDRIRHAVTKLADLHLCATDEAARRILAMGEEPRRVHRVGAPALDAFTGIEALGPGRLDERLGFPVERPFGIVTYHAPTIDRRSVGPRAEAVIGAVRRELASAVITAPGADPGGDEVLAVVEDAVRGDAGLHFVANLGRDYPAVLASADVMVGNSSSGIVEAASFRLPVVDVGERQHGRLAAANVVHCGESEDEVAAAVRSALDPDFAAGLEDLVNPYGDGTTGARIAAILSEVDLGALAHKVFTPLPRGDGPMGATDG